MRKLFGIVAVLLLSITAIAQTHTFPAKDTDNAFTGKNSFSDLVNACADAGSTDAYACTITPAISAYVTGVHYSFKANTVNTGAATINFNSIGAKSIKKAGGGITTDLANNDIQAGQWVDLIYDGTNMEMQSTLGNVSPSGTTYYVSNSGGDSNSGLTPALAWQTISKVNASTLNPGDSFLFDCGLWREQLTIPSSGVAGKQITFGSYCPTGMPEITGADVQASWTNETVYYYASGYTSDPGTVIKNGVMLTELALKASVVNGAQWWWDPVNFRVYIFGNPSGSTMEIAARASAVDTNGKSFVTVNGLWLESGTNATVNVSSGSANFILGSLNAAPGTAFLVNNSQFGVATSNTVGDNGQILNGRVSNSNKHGIVIGNGNINNWTVSGIIGSGGGYANPSSGTNCSDIYLSTGTGVNKVQNSNFYGAGLGPGNGTTVVCHGIYNDAGANLIQNNFVHDNAGAGIQTHANGTIIGGNVIIRNAIGVQVENGATGVQVVGNLNCYNYNPTQNNEAGLYVQGSGTTISSHLNNLYCGNSYPFGGNILSNQTIYVQSSNSITTSNGNLYWGTTDGENLLNYQGSNNTFASWQGLGKDAAGKSQDPLLISPSTLDFRPAPGSPVIDAGINAGSPFQYGLSVSTPGWPFALANQYSNGTGPEIGPFVYSTASLPPTQQSFTVNPKTATYQAVAADFAGCKTIPVASGTFTITLVDSTAQPSSGQCIRVINYGSGVVTIARSGQNINGAASNLTMAAGSASAPTGMYVVSDGVQYLAQPIANLVGVVTNASNLADKKVVVGSGGAGGVATDPGLSYPSTGSLSLGVNGTAGGLLTLQGSASGSCGISVNSSGGTMTAGCVYAANDFNGTVGATAAKAGKFTTLTETTLLVSNAAPTISSGFGTSPSIASNNGTASFTINVGTGASASSGVIGLPAATTGWSCQANDLTAAAAHVAYNTRQTASTTASATLENQTTSTGAAVAWAASDILRVSCLAY